MSLFKVNIVKILFIGSWNHLINLLKESMFIKHLIFITNVYKVGNFTSYILKVSKYNE